MTTAPLAHTDVIVLDYLAALWAGSEDLSPDLRDEMMTTIADYIAARRAAGGPVEDATAIIRRLGPPDALIDACRRGHLPPHVRLPALIPPPAPAPVPPAQAGGAAEYAAIGLMTVGSLIVPVAAPLAGLLLATGSPHWTVTEKATAWVLVGGSGAAGAVLTLLLAATAGGGPLALVVIYLVLCGGSVAAGAQLSAYLRHHSRRQAG